MTNSLDRVSKSFRHTIEPEVCYESSQHQLLLIKSLNSEDTQFIAYHMHGSANGKKRIYERFTVSKTEVTDMRFIGYTHRSPSDIEQICEYQFGIAKFIIELSDCYLWSRNALIILTNPSLTINKHHYMIYTAFLQSYSTLCASSQFVNSQSI